MKGCWTPSPRYSLCKLDTLVDRVLTLVRRGPAGRRVHHVADPIPYRQHEIAAWFDGPLLTVPVILTRPLYWGLRLVPGQKTYALRCLYWKLLNSDLYATTEP